jgi:peptidoglycan/xylan/chitin deacetylase (PgdA/CDA1 family)
MQDHDAEVINNQRKRRKRIGRIRNGIIFTIAGWIIISMILIAVLFVQVIKIQHKLDQIVTVSTVEQTQQENAQKPESAGESVYTDVTEATETKSDYDPVTPPATGISEEDNLASESDVHKVYLTFEDGPSENTEAILDILAQYNVKATFFVVGKEDEDSQELYKRIVEEGHTLGMHSYSNKYSQIYQSKDAFEEDFNRLRDELYQVTGVESIYYRFPGGSSNQISNVPMSDFIHYLNEQGVIYYDWNISAGDAASNAYSAEEIVANVVDDVVKYKTSVVLLHDASDKSTTVEALAPIIEALNEMGAEILPIDEDTSVIQYVKADSID